MGYKEVKRYKVAVLGRGASLSKYRDHHKEFSHIYFVNNFTNEIRRIGIKRFMGKDKVVQVVGSGHNWIPIKFYRDISIYSVVVNKLDIKEFKAKKQFPKIARRRMRPLPQIMAGRGIHSVKRDKYHWPTAGIMALELVLCEGYKEVHLFGIDFYKSSYMITPDKKPSERNREKYLQMLNYTKKLVKEFSHVQFYSAFPVDIKLPNWNILKE